MLGGNRSSPCRIMRSHFGLLLGLDANPVFRDDKRAARLVRHMASHATCDSIYRAQTRVLRYGRAMASQARFFGPGDQHTTRRVLVRVVTVCTRDLTPTLAPALAVFQRRHLIGNERVVGHGVLNDTGSRVTLRAWPHPLGNGQLARVQYAEVSRVAADRGQMRLARTVAILASHAGLDARSVSSRRAVAAEAPHFQIRRQYAAQSRFIIGGLLIGKTERKRQMVALRKVEVPGFE